MVGRFGVGCMAIRRGRRRRRKTGRGANGNGSDTSSE